MNITTTIRRLSLLAIVAAGIGSSALAETRSNVSPSLQDLISRGAEPANPCGDLVRECFAYSGQHFENCIHVSSDHPFCERTALGGLIQKRWQMAPSQPSLDGVPGFLGPRMVNRECVKNFDIQLSARLGSGDLTNEVVQSLTQSLNACSQEVPADLLRP